MNRSNAEYSDKEELYVQPGILGIIRRRFLHIMLGVLIGSTISTIYFFQQVPVYESELTVLVGQRASELASTGQSRGGVAAIGQNDIVATHIELMTSRKIIEDAISRGGLPVSIVQIFGNLHVSKGGDGAFANAGVLKARYEADDPDIAAKVLQSVYDSYLTYVEEKSTNVGAEAAALIANSLVQCEKELKDADARYRDYIASCPAIVGSDGQGVENIHALRLQKLESELAVVRQSLPQLQSRFTVVKDFARGRKPEELSSLDIMTVLDETDVSRLMTMLDMNNDSTKRGESTSDAVAAEASRLAVTYEQKLLELNVKKEQLESAYGTNHPKYLALMKEINSAQSIIDRARKSAPPQNPFGSGPPTGVAPSKLLTAYVNVLVSDIKGLEAREKELLALSGEESRLAKEIETSCLSSAAFKSQLDRARARYDQVFTRLQEITLTNSVTGFSTDLLDPPTANREPVSPNKRKIAALGILAGGLLGLCFAFVAEFTGRSVRGPRKI